MITPKEIVRSNRKTIALVVNNKGELIVRAPCGVGDEQITAAIRNKQRWIEEKQRIVKTFFERYSDSTFTVGESLMYMGNFYMLDYADAAGVTLDGNKILLPSSKKHIAAETLKDWYIMQAEKLVKERVDFYANKIGAKYSALKLSDAKARWGSCSKKQSININWRVIMCPQFVVDYVIVHQLSHLQYKNHGEDFRKRVETIMPDYRNAQEWLQQNSGLINTY